MLELFLCFSIRPAVRHGGPSWRHGRWLPWVSRTLATTGSSLPVLFTCHFSLKRSCTLISPRYGWACYNTTRTFLRCSRVSGVHCVRFYSHVRKLYSKGSHFIDVALVYYQNSNGFWYTKIKVWDYKPSRKIISTHCYPFDTYYIPRIMIVTYSKEKLNSTQRYLWNGLQNGLYSALPYMFQVVSCLASGNISTALFKRQLLGLLTVRRLFQSVCKFDSHKHSTQIQ